MLGELLLGAAAGAAAAIEDDRAGRGRALVESEDEAGHDRTGAR
jgi:hypothetical protein